MRKKSVMRFVILGLACAIVIVVDQLSKTFVRTHLGLWVPHNVIPGVFQILYVRNTGAAFGVLKGAIQYFVFIALAVVSGVILFLTRSKRASTFEVISLSLIVAGALGNLIDRVTVGFVTDFFYIKLIDFPVFNVADMAVTLGTILFIIWVVFFSSSHEKRRDSGAPEDKNVEEFAVPRHGEK